MSTVWPSMGCSSKALFYFNSFEISTYYVCLSEFVCVCARVCVECVSEPINSDPSHIRRLGPSFVADRGHNFLRPNDLCFCKDHFV